MNNIFFGGDMVKKHIIGLVVCFVLFSSIIVPVASIDDKRENRAISCNDVPIWDVGDEWTYHFTESRSHMVNYILSGDLSLKVVDDSGDSYILEAATRPKGAFDLSDLGFNIGLKTTKLTKFSMRLQIRKADLALENVWEQLKGFLFIKIGPLTVPIPIQVEEDVNVEFDPPWVIMPFPLYDGKSGILSGTEILHINAYMQLFWGLISVFGPQNYSIPVTPVPYTCSEEQITVQGRPFDVYNVSAEREEGSRFMSYYAEEVGNVAKETIYIPYGGGRVLYSLILELKDWSYTP